MSTLFKVLAALCVLMGCYFPWLLLLGLGNTGLPILLGLPLLAATAPVITYYLAQRLPQPERRHRIWQVGGIWLLISFVFVVFSGIHGPCISHFFFIPATLLMVSTPYVFLGPVAHFLFSNLDVPKKISNHASHYAGEHFSVALVFSLLICSWMSWTSITLANDWSCNNMMLSKGRGIWTAVISSNSERDPRGLCAVWPKDLRFSGRDSSTTYFQRLLADETGQPTDDSQSQLCSDLSIYCFSGPGICAATNMRTFGALNNAWQVVCIASNDPPDAPFLITRNADFGDMLTPTSRVQAVANCPITMHSVVWVTRGGSCLCSPLKNLKAETFFRFIDKPKTNLCFQVMKP